MYGYQNNSGDVAKVVGILIVVGLVVTLGLGAVLGRSELLNPLQAEARAAKLQAEAEAARAQAMQEQRQRDLENQAQAQKLQAELEAARAQAMREQQQVELEREQLAQQAAYEQRLRELQEQWAREQAEAQLEALRQRQAITVAGWEIMVTMAPIVVFAVLFVPAVAAGYYIFERAQAVRLARTAPGPQHRRQRAKPSGSSAAPHRGPALSGGTQIRRSKISATRRSYDGFLGFVVDFFLSAGDGKTSANWAEADDDRLHYPAGISAQIAKAYLSILRLARGLVRRSDDGSGWVLRDEIRTVDDIVRRFPRQAFEKLLDAPEELDFAELEARLEWCNCDSSEDDESDETEPAVLTG